MEKTKMNSAPSGDVQNPTWDGVASRKQSPLGPALPHSTTKWLASLPPLTATH